MRYYLPDLEPAAEPEPSSSGILSRWFGSKADTNGAVRGSRERLGGVPFGLDPASWPTCRDCGKSQSLLAQFDHHPDRLDLGRPGRVLMVFQCNHDPGMCETWDAFSGANACLILEPEELGDSDAPVPLDQPRIEHCASIKGWIAKDDPVPEEIAPQFFSCDGYSRVDAALIESMTWSTRLGSVPCWIQSPDETPKPDWRFLGQLDSVYSFIHPPERIKSWVSPDTECFEGRTHVGEGPDFGDSGMAYHFLRDGAQRPEAVMFWQCS